MACAYGGGVGVKVDHAAQVVYFDQGEDFAVVAFEGWYGSAGLSCLADVVKFKGAHVASVKVPFTLRRGGVVEVRS